MGEFDFYFALLGFDMAAGVAALDPTVMVEYGGVSTRNPLRRIARAVSRQTETATQQFLLKKLKALHDVANLEGDDATAQINTDKNGLFGNKVGAHEGNTKLQAALATGKTDGLLDSLNDGWDDPALDLAVQKRKVDLFQMTRNVLRETNFDKLGSSYFQGLIYTEGDFTAQNEVKVMGSLMAVGPTSSIHLRNGVSLTYVPELARQSGDSLGLVGVRAWVRR